MKLVAADAPFNAGKANLSGKERDLSRAVFEIIQAFRREASEHDEDPEFDADDALSALMKSYGFGRELVAHFMSAESNIPRDVEAIAHAVVRCLGVLDELLPEAGAAEPVTDED